MNFLAWNTGTKHIGPQLIFEIVVQKEGIVSDFSPSREISRRSQMLTSTLLGEHEILARVIIRIILKATGVNLCQSDPLIFYLWVDWLLRPPGRESSSQDFSKENSQFLFFLIPFLKFPAYHIPSAGVFFL